jgi:glycosyltransferase involved in cell wall biosynthesis
MKSCVIIVQNLPVPMKRRTWQQACALRDSGWTVDVVCPANNEFPLSFETIDEIRVHRYNLPFEARGRMGFLREYGVSLFHILRLLRRIGREYRFKVIQIVNPPDLLCIPALLCKLLYRSKVVYDQADLCPELFRAKFSGRGLLYSCVLLLERIALKCADIVVSPNETYRQVAITRGSKSPAAVVTVHTFPETSHFDVTPAFERSPDKVRVGYFGVIGDQDGVDEFIRAVVLMARVFGEKTLEAVVVGDGPALVNLTILAKSLGIQSMVTFTGFLTGKRLLDTIASFDIGVITDRFSAHADCSSMNKTYMYAALGIPIVSVPLTETKRLLADAAIFADGFDSVALAASVLLLAKDHALRRELGHKARTRAETNFVWNREAKVFVTAFESIV